MNPRAPMDPDDARLRGEQAMPLFDRAAPRLRIDTHEPSAPDGARWKAAAIEQARRLVRVHGEVRPSWLRAACEEPPHPAFWGSVWARLRAMGLRRTTETHPSPSKLRNAAREAVWKPGPDWGAA